MALQGNIDSFSVVDVLRLLGSSSKSGRLVVDGDRGSGSLWLGDGSVLGGTTTRTGASAVAAPPSEVLFDVLRFSEGAFVFDAGLEPTELARSGAGPAVDVESMIAEAEEALVEAKVPAGQVEIVGAGASGYAVDAVRAGRWHATFLALPFDEGKLAGEMAVHAGRGEAIADPGIDPVEHRGLPAFMTADNLEMFADFEPQWPG